VKTTMVQQQSHPPVLDYNKIRPMVIGLLHAYRRNLAEHLTLQ